MGSKSAVTIHLALVRVLLRQLSGLTDCHIRFCFSPDDAHDAVKFWLLPEIIDHREIALDPAAIDFHPQGPGHHGERLSRAITRGFEQGYRKVAAIGTDCIELSARWIHAAFVQLNARHEAVLGPTPGGHHHLIGLRTPHPDLLHGIPWHSSAAYQVSISRAAELGIPTYALPAVPEILTSSDYKAALDGPLGPAIRKAMESLDA